MEHMKGCVMDMVDASSPLTGIRAAMLNANSSIESLVTAKGNIVAEIEEEVDKREVARETEM